MQVRTTRPADITAEVIELRRLRRRAAARDHAEPRPPPARLRHRGRADGGGVARRRSPSSPPPATSPTIAARSSSSGPTRSGSRCSSTRSRTRARPGATESTVLGPVLRPGRAAARATATTSRPSRPATPAWVHGRVLDLDGTADRRRRARRLAERRRPSSTRCRTPEARRTTCAAASAPATTARTRSSPCARCRTRSRDDGPVGAMLDATGRHPWRPAHIHLIVRAPGYAHASRRTSSTRRATYLDSDAVFAVKPSLLREFRARDPPTPTARTGWRRGARSRTTSCWPPRDRAAYRPHRFISRSCDMLDLHCRDRQRRTGEVRP